MIELERKLRVYGLCEGRHQIPAVEKYIFPAEVDPLDISGLEKTVEEVLKPRPFGCWPEDPVYLYVTGLTVALVAVINVCYRYGIELCLWHYNRDTGEYYPQRLDMRARCDIATYGVRCHDCYGL